MKAINSGSFHNDIVSLSTENVFIFHEEAFNDSKNEIQKNVNKETEELNKINEIEELSQDLSKESDVDKILFKDDLSVF